MKYEKDESYVFEDEFGKWRGYESGLSLHIQALEDSDMVEICITKKKGGTEKIRGCVAVSRKTIGKLIRALSSCKDELEERRWDACFGYGCESDGE